VQQRWIGRATGDNMSLTCWPPRSPYLTPCDLFLWGYVKGKGFVPLGQVTLDDLKQRITTAKLKPVGEPGYFVAS
jgi:hypothetical protein